MARRLAAAMNAPVVELDALNWLPDWVSLAETDPQAFEARVVEATAGEAWVLAGSYMNFTRRLCWGRLQSVVWLDLSLSLILRRVVSRSWRRWRSRELLWGTNRESFLTHLKVWSKDSLLGADNTQAETAQSAGGHGRSSVGAHPLHPAHFGG